MAKWTTEKMVEELKSLLGNQLVSVVLYGSAAAGDHSGKNSDINLLVVTRALHSNEFLGLSKAAVPWKEQGNPPPLFLTEERLKDYVEVFPVEMKDIQHNHRVLFGPDPVEGLSVSHDHLRVELEHELQGKLIQLRTHFMLTEARPGMLEKLMVDSLATFLVLFKSALWLYGVTPPARKMEALQKLKDHVPFDHWPFEVADRLKQGEKIKGLDVMEAFEKYLAAIESIVDHVNK
jgi:hypothetical protein